MYTITWISNGKIKSISHPVESVIMNVWFGMLAIGKKARMWGPDKQLIV